MPDWTFILTDLFVILLFNISFIVKPSHILCMCPGNFLVYIVQILVFILTKIFFSSFTYLASVSCKHTGLCSADFSVHFNWNFCFVHHMFLRLFPAIILVYILPIEAFILTERFVLSIKYFCNFSCKHTGVYIVPILGCILTEFFVWYTYSCSRNRADYPIVLGKCLWLTMVIYFWGLSRYEKVLKAVWKPKL